MSSRAKPGSPALAGLACAGVEERGICSSLNLRRSRFLVASLPGMTGRGLLTANCETAFTRLLGQVGWRRRRKGEETSRGLHFPIALHPISRRKLDCLDAAKLLPLDHLRGGEVDSRRVADDSRRVLASSPNRLGVRLRRRFRRNLRWEQPVKAFPAPFARTSEAPRKSRPGY